MSSLLWEHRLIEHMVNLLRSEIDRITSKKTANVILIEQAVDFFRTYADRTHHGKEEEILFRDLAQKKMSLEHRKTMDELLREYIQGRQRVRKIVEAKDFYVNGCPSSAHCEGTQGTDRVLPEAHRERGQGLFSPA